jgi:hypothetical protein
LPIYNNTEEIDANVDEGKDTKDLYYESEELGCPGSETSKSSESSSSNKQEMIAGPSRQITVATSASKADVIGSDTPIAPVTPFFLAAPITTIRNFLFPGDTVLSTASPLVTSAPIQSTLTTVEDAQVNVFEDFDVPEPDAPEMETDGSATVSSDSDIDINPQETENIPKETIINFFHLDEDIIDGNNLRLWFETKYSKYVEEDDYRNDLQLLCGKFYELTDSRKLSNIKNTPAENKFKSSVRKVFRDLYEKGKLDKIVNINPID